MAPKKADKKPAAKTTKPVAAKKKGKKSKARRARPPRPARSLTRARRADRVLQDLHLQGAEAGAPGHRHLLQGHVHHVRACAPLAPRALAAPARRG